MRWGDTNCFENIALGLRRWDELNRQRKYCSMKTARRWTYSVCMICCTSRHMTRCGHSPWSKCWNGVVATYMQKTEASQLGNFGCVHLPCLLFASVKSRGLRHGNWSVLEDSGSSFGLSFKRKLIDQRLQLSGLVLWTIKTSEMTGQQASSLGLWPHSPSTVVTISDIAAFVSTACVFLMICLSRNHFFSQSSEIPHDFWYQVPQQQSAQTKIKLKQSSERNIAELLANQVRYIHQ